MFQLIVAVISIVLVAALAIASIYYGGEAFNKSSLKANVTTLVNGGQQIAGAQALYRTDKAVDATSFASLTGADPAYLAAIPGLSKIADATGAWDITGGKVASVKLDSAAVEEACKEAFRQANVDEATAIPADAPIGQFGCYTATGGTYFGFKL